MSIKQQQNEQYPDSICEKQVVLHLTSYLCKVYMCSPYRLNVASRRHFICTFIILCFSHSIISVCIPQCIDLQNNLLETSNYCRPQTDGIRQYYNPLGQILAAGLITSIDTVTTTQVMTFTKSQAFCILPSLIWCALKQFPSTFQ